MAYAYFWNDLGFQGLFQFFKVLYKDNVDTLLHRERVSKAYCMFIKISTPTDS